MLRVVSIGPSRLESGNCDGGWIVIQVSESVPGERARMVVIGQSTEDNSQCTVIVIHEEKGSWAIHGLGNQGVRVTTADMVELGQIILGRVR